MKILKDYNNMRLLSDSDEKDLEYAANIIKNGGLVGIPTETVYGLGANALNPEAVKRIFEVKGRPCDNPLIVHISDISMLDKLVHDVPQVVYSLAEKFWAGPLTMILPKNSCIPVETSGGLDTVGIRMPASKFTRALIEKSGCPIAAPSANISGYPSPTKAEHVCSDLRGKIEAVVDGGECKVGVESTVIAFEDNTIKILRPGYITVDDLKPFAKNVYVDKAVTDGLADGERASSPGMKYKHYSPNADVVLVEGDSKAFEAFASDVMKNNTSAYIVAFDSELTSSDNANHCLHYGKNSKEQAKNIFSLLRQLDKIGAEKVYIHSPKKDGVGLAVFNRLIRAAGFEVISL